MLVTPRKLRPPLEVGASRKRQQNAEESTPKRGLRKCLEKIQRMQIKAAKGEHERIVAKPVEVSGATPGQTARSPLGPAVAEEGAAAEHPALCSVRASLNNENSLEAARAALDFLSSIRLLHCKNCDEEWPVFDASWPQIGVPWAGR